jgi:hypothetical protein
MFDFEGLIGMRCFVYNLLVVGVRKETLRTFHFELTKGVLGKLRALYHSTTFHTSLASLKTSHFMYRTPSPKRSITPPLSPKSKRRVTKQSRWQERQSNTPRFLHAYQLGGPALIKDYVSRMMHNKIKIGEGDEGI